MAAKFRPVSSIIQFSQCNLSAKCSLIRGIILLFGSMRLTSTLLASSSNRTNSKKLCDSRPVYRARKVQRFLSQPFFVAENFTGTPGRFVPVKETIEGFKAILDGEMDDYPEAAFFNVGNIDDVKAKAEQMAKN